MKKNNSLLITILSGAIFCFVCLGMVFLFPSSTKKLNSSNESAFPNADEHGYVPDEEISLGDSCTATGCPNGGSPIGGYCYSNVDGSWDSSHTGGCSGYVANNTCYRSRYTASLVCTSCDSGRYLDSNNQCQSCPAGSYCYGNEMHSCPAGKSSVPNSTSYTDCTTCSTGYISSAGGVCTRCADTNPGTTSNSSHTQCIQESTGCEAGEYKGSEACEKCPNGYTSTAGAAFTTSDCYVNAGPGKQVASAHAQVSDCPANTYSNSSKKVMYGDTKLCTSCGEGKTTSSTGATSESQCIDIKISCASITDAGTCTTRSDCEWDYTNYCHDKPKPCGDYGNLTDCNNAGCSWSYSGNYCEAKKQVLTSLTGGGNAYVTPDTCKTFHLQAKDADGKIVPASWSVSGSHQTNSCSSGSGVCSVTVCGWTCPATGSVRVSASYNGVTKTTTINITSYEKWSDNDWNKIPNNGENAYIYNTTSLDHNVCYGYSDPYEEGGVTKYKKRYTRCCGSGTPVTPTPAVPYCYTDDDGNYYWTTSPDSNWKIVDNITKEDNCKKEETEACYLTPSGTYEWGKHAKDDGYTLITAITTSGACKTPTDEACYKKDNDYIWTTSAPEGYEKVENAKTPAECTPPETPACYLHGNSFVWGKYEKVSGYIFVENIDEEANCKKPDTDACYVDSKGDYVWGKYGDAEGYTLVPSVTEMSQCKNDVPTPKTDISISKIIYIFMAILMAFGVGFIYYSSTAKKNN